MIELKPLLIGPPVLTLCVAESITCGLIQARIGSISGASGFFLGGITAYTLDQKVRHLGVERESAAAVECVSQEVAEQMARGACALFNSDLALATTGFAEPKDGVPEPYAWWGLAQRRPDGTLCVSSGRKDCPGARRNEARALVADSALAALLALVRSIRR